MLLRRRCLVRLVLLGSGTDGSFGAIFQVSVFGLLVGLIVEIVFVNVFVWFVVEDV